jgi:hypothetical protein
MRSRELQQRAQTMSALVLWDLLQKNILATFHSGNELAGTTIICMVSEFLQ